MKAKRRPKTQDLRRKLTPQTTPPSFEIEQATPNSHLVTFRDVRAGWEQWVLLSSDRHHDNAFCRQDMELAHLEQAKERQAVIVDAGDLFDVMQGKDDRRQSKDELRVENKRTAYLDSVIKSAAEFYGPYARHFAVIGRGNHESAILGHHGVDLISNLVHRLNADHGGRVYAGGYGGWVVFRFYIHQTVCTARFLKYFHGSGGGGAVTRGVIQTNRMAVTYPDADIVFSGHTHDSWIVPIARERLSQKGFQFQDVAYHVRTPTYKDEYRAGEGGWHVERGGPPKPLGAVWLRFILTDANEGKIGFEVTPAIG